MAIRSAANAVRETTVSMAQRASSGLGSGRDYVVRRTTSALTAPTALIGKTIDQIKDSAAAGGYIAPRLSFLVRSVEIAAFGALESIRSLCTLLENLVANLCNRELRQLKADFCMDIRHVLYDIAFTVVSLPVGVLGTICPCMHKVYATYMDPAALAEAAETPYVEAGIDAAAETSVRRNLTPQLEEAAV